MKIVKTILKEVPSTGKAIEYWNYFISLYIGKIVQVSGPFMSLKEGRSGLPDYILSGSIIIEDEGNKLNG